MQRFRSVLVTTAAVCAAAIGGGAIANAASSGTSSTSPTTTPSPPANPGSGAPHGAPPGSSGFDPSKGGHTLNGKTETLLTGETAEKVRAAALAKVSGTVQRVETNVDDDVPYEAHIVKSDGEQVVVEVNSDYTVASVKAMGAGHPGMPPAATGTAPSA
jgi:hypothetical protein